MVDNLPTARRSLTREGRLSTERERRGLTLLWRQTSPALRQVVVWMWVVGVAVLCAGLWIDWTRWWSDRPFLSNLSSSLVGLLFSVPFALVVVQRISVTEAERAERRSAIRLAMQATEHLRRATDQLRGDDMDRGQVDRGAVVLEQARKVTGFDQWRRRDAYDELSDDLNSIGDWLEQNRGHLVSWVAAVAASWSMWKVAAANRLYLLEIDVIDFSLIGRIDESMKALVDVTQRELRVPSEAFISGTYSNRELSWRFGDLMMAEEISSKMSEVAVRREADTNTAAQLADLARLLRSIQQIDEHIMAVAENVAKLGDADCARQST